jgi:hypothetical protein
MPTNMMDFMKMVKNGNPQEMVMGMLKQTAQTGNPMATNLINLINSGDMQGVERLARNVARERGIDFDKEFNSFKQMFRNF